MPEHAEIRIMSDYVNSFVKKFRCEKIYSSPYSKQINPNLVFDSPRSIAADARGKELKISISRESSSILLTMGMSGSFLWLRDNQHHKHTQLFFEGFSMTNDLIKVPITLELVDTRHFAKWKSVNPNTWGPNRGPDPVMESKKFLTLLSNLSDKRLDTPLCELLLEQSVFNGVGNYLRAHICAALNINPFETFRYHLSKKGDEFILALANMVILSCQEAYLLNGGQLKDWKNPNGKDNSNFKTWLRAYNRGLNLVDGTGRRFWFEEKWREDANKYVTKYNLNII